MIVIGRNNFALTVYVPYDCANNCKFCPSKAMYKKYKMADVESMKESIKKIASSKEIKDVVFTGGEPQYNMKLLRELVSAVPASKDIYINTTLPEKNLYEFVDFVNTYKQIKGVNISRHDISIEEDRKILNNVCSDDVIKFFNKPVKINVVLSNAINSVAFEAGLENFILKVCKRWEKFDNVTVCFREDYTTMDEDFLHKLKNDTTKIFLDNMEYSGHSFCEVCDTMHFVYTSELNEDTDDDFDFSDDLNKINVSYHRGLEHSCVKIDERNLIINDIIIFPDGTIGYDWDKKTEKIEEVLDVLKVKNVSVDTDTGVLSGAVTKKRTSVPKPAFPGISGSSSASSSYSGSSCGGWGRC